MALDLPVAPQRLPSQLVRTDGWVVAWRSSAVGGVRVVRTRSCTRLRVADGHSGLSTDVELRGEGVVSVFAGATPPALLVGATDVRTLPTLPGGAETAQVDVGQRLLVLSSDALDALPVSLAAVLQSLPARLAHRDPDELLRELTADLDVGSAAIIVRETDPSDLRGQTSETKEGTWASAAHS